MNKFMEIAAEEAKIAANEGEIPVGAAVFLGDRLISKAHNKTEQNGDATSHAEMLAMSEACRILGAKYLTDCSLYVTLEPCAMCAGAAHNLKISKIYFGAYDTKSGALGGKIDIVQEGVFDFKPEVYGGIMEEECEKIIKEFFCKMRREKSGGK